MTAVRLHLVDGTYELFRSYYGAPKRTSPEDLEVGATVGLMAGLAALIRTEGVTHLACAFDTVIESFRNDLYPGYKTGEGVEPELAAQFALVEEAVRAMGITVWSMVEFEADDALATAAALWGEDHQVEQIVLCSPDKDLAQCVRGRRVVGLDRRRERIIDEEEVRRKFGVSPASIPDWLALVGDGADGFPGLPGWGEKTASRVLARYPHLEDIPEVASRWEVSVRNAERLSRTLKEKWKEAELYRRLATLRTDVPIAEQLKDLRWRGAPREKLEPFCRRIGARGLVERVPAAS